MRHLVNMIEKLKERGIGFRSISEGMIDTTSASRELLLNIFSALAQFERRLILRANQTGPYCGQSTWSQRRDNLNWPVGSPHETE